MVTHSDPALAKGPAIAAVGHGRAYLAVALVLPIALVAFVALQLRTEWQRLGHEIEVTTSTVAQILAEHTDRLFENADLVRLQTAEMLGRDGPIPVEFEHFQQLNRFAAAAPPIVSIWVGDADGRAVLTSRQFPAPDLSAADRDYFRAVRDDPDALFVGTLSDNRYTDEILINTNRRLPSVDGSFRGFVQVSLSPDYIRDTFRSVQLSYQAALWWLAPDGRVLLREPTLPHDALTNLAPEGLEAIGDRAGGSFLGPSRLDGVERRFFFRTSPEYGNTILLSVQTEELRRLWWERVRTTLGLGVLLLAATFAIMVFVRREQRRGRAHTSELEAEVRARTRELRDAVEQKELVLRELRHRVGNAYATIQALAQQMLRTSDDFASFKADFPRRLQALAATQTMLVNSENRGAELADLIWTELAPYRGRGGRGAVVEGPAVTLPSVRAVAAGLVLHELVTNSVKYGALSVPDGSVTARWRTEDGTLVLDWSEAGGPPVEPVARRGFGTEMLERAARFSGGRIEISHQPEGVRAELRLPLDTAD